jgi:multidrug efflux pump subunit AcrA (membrane-fusion protein)
MVNPDMQKSPTDVTSTAALSGPLRLQWPSSLVIVALFVVVHALLAFGDTSSVDNLPITLASYLAVCLAAAAVALPMADPLPRGSVTSALVLCAISATLAYTQEWPENPSPFAHWHLGAVTIVLVVLAVRGRVGAAWVAYALLFAGTVAWALIHGLGVGDGVAMIIRHAGTLLAGTLFAVGRRRAATRLLATNDARTAAAYEQAQAIAAIEEREAQLARVNAMARPTLERLARAGEMGAAERAECLQIEASLRDAMRGRLLFVDPIIAAARSARARGVEVTLIDDHGDDSSPDLTAVIERVTEELDSVSSGRFTARVLPEGRGDLATIVVDSETHRMFVIASESLAREPDYQGS